MSSPYFEYHRYRRYFTDIRNLYGQKRAKTYAGTVFFFLVASFFIFFAIKPSLATIATLRRQIADQKTVSQKLDAKIAAISQAQQEFYRLNLNEKFYLLNEALPPQPQISQLIFQLELLSKASNIQLANLRYEKIPIQPIAQSKEAQKVQFNLTINSTYLDLIAFLNKLSLLRRIVSLNSLDIKTNPNTKEPLTLMLTINADFYYWAL